VDGIDDDTFGKTSFKSVDWWGRMKVKLWPANATRWPAKVCGILPTKASRGFLRRKSFMCGEKQQEWQRWLCRKTVGRTLAMPLNSLTKVHEKQVKKLYRSDRCKKSNNGLRK